MLLRLDTRMHLEAAKQVREAGEEGVGGKEGRGGRGGRAGKGESAREREGAVERWGQEREREEGGRAGQGEGWGPAAVGLSLTEPAARRAPGGDSSPCPRRPRWGS